MPRVAEAITVQFAVLRLQSSNIERLYQTAFAVPLRRDKHGFTGFPSIELLVTFWYMDAPLCSPSSPPTSFR